MANGTGGSRLGEHAVYPGTFDPVVGRADRRVLPEARAGVIIRGARNRSDLLHEYQLAAMNEAMGITTLVVPAQPGLAAVSSTVLRGLGTFPGVQPG